MKTKKLLYFSVPILSFSALPVYAICPLCVIAIGAGLGLSEYLGIDDTISGLWIGAFLVATSIWTIEWFNKKKFLMKYQKLRDIATFVLFYGLTIWPLWEQGFIGHPFHQLWGIDKLILGIAIGSIVFLGATNWYQKIKKAHGGHAQFPFQNIVIPVSTLLVFSIIFYFIVSF